MVETQQLVWNASLNKWEEQLVSTLNQAPILNQSLYVSKSGSDDTGNGSSANPFLTIEYALSAIAGQSSLNRFAVNVMPGQYSEPFKIRPWTAVMGADAGSNGVSPDGAMLVEITAAADSLGFSSDWSSAGHAVAWMSGLGFLNHQTWDEDGYGLQPGMSPQLNFKSCSFDAGVSFLGSGTAGSDNVMMDDCLFYGGALVKGMNYLWLRNCDFLGGVVSVESGAALATEDTKLLAQNSSFGSDASPTNIMLLQDGYSSHYAKADLSNCAVVGDLSLDGYLTAYNATIGGIPCSVSLLHGASAPVSMSCLPGGGGGSKDYAMFYALMPGDNSATIAINAPFLLPQHGPSSGAIVALSSSTFQLPTVGNYEVFFQASVSEAAQVGLALNGALVLASVVGRATGTNQIVLNTIISVSSANSILSVINANSAAALTLTPIAGGTNSVSANLVVKAL